MQLGHRADRVTGRLRKRLDASVAQNGAAGVGVGQRHPRPNAKRKRLSLRRSAKKKKGYHGPHSCSDVCARRSVSGASFLELNGGVPGNPTRSCSWPSKGQVEKSDQELVRHMLAGDEEAFTALYRRRQAGVFRFALQMTGSVVIAEDVTQEVFMTLLETGSRYDP